MLPDRYTEWAEQVSKLPNFDAADPIRICDRLIVESVARCPGLCEFPAALVEQVVSEIRDALVATLAARAARSMA